MQPLSGNEVFHFPFVILRRTKFSVSRTTRRFGHGCWPGPERSMTLSPEMTEESRRTLRRSGVQLQITGLHGSSFRQHHHSVILFAVQARLCTICRNRRSCSARPPPDNRGRSVSSARSERCSPPPSAGGTCLKFTWQRTRCAQTGEPTVWFVATGGRQ